MRGRMNRFQRGVRHCLAELEQSQWLPREDLLAVQQAKLASLCAHAYSNSKYYRQVFDDAAINVDTTDLSNLVRIPILEKHQIRENFTDITSTAYQIDDLIQQSSGGSTGEPVRVLQAPSAGQFGAAIKRRSYAWTGWFPGVAHHWLWGASIDVSKKSMKRAIWSRVYNREFTNAYQTSDALFRQRYEIYARRPPYLLESYANILYEFAKFIEYSGLRRLDIPAVITSAETLHDFQRALIEKTISRKIYNRYGCREVGDIAHECEQHSDLHINMERFIIELDATDDDGIGDILVTDLESRAFPLLRYRIGDRGSLSTQSCQCGRGLLMLKQVTGRTLDVVITPEGQKISGVLFPRIFREFDQIILGQVIQHSATELEIRMRLHAEFPQEAENRLVGMISAHTGPSISINLNYTEDMLVTPTGKHRPVISKIVS